MNRILTTCIGLAMMSSVAYADQATTMEHIKSIEETVRATKKLAADEDVNILMVGRNATPMRFEMKMNGTRKDVRISFFAVLPIEVARKNGMALFAPLEFECHDRGADGAASRCLVRDSVGIVHNADIVLPRKGRQELYEQIIAHINAMVLVTAALNELMQRGPPAAETREGI